MFQPCRHVVGRVCVRSWHARNGGHITCPICRTELSDETVGAMLGSGSAEDEVDISPPMSAEQVGLWMQSLERQVQNTLRRLEENEQEMARRRARMAEEDEEGNEEEEA